MGSTTIDPFGMLIEVGNLFDLYEPSGIANSRR